jgi:hypothetical protein
MAPPRWPRRDGPARWPRRDGPAGIAPARWPRRDGPAATVRRDGPAAMAPARWPRRDGPARWPRRDSPAGWYLDTTLPAIQHQKNPSRQVGAHLTFLRKPPPPTLGRWSGGFAPESAKTTDAPAGFIPVERWLKTLMSRGDSRSVPSFPRRDGFDVHGENNHRSTGVKPAGAQEHERLLLEQNHGATDVKSEGAGIPLPARI